MRHCPKVPTIGKGEYIGEYRILLLPEAGSQEERQSFEEKGREIVTELSYRMTIRASENNRNEIPIQGILTDFAGHTAGTAGMPEVL